MGKVTFIDVACDPQQINGYSPFMGAHAHVFCSTWKILPASFAGAVGGEFSMHEIQGHELLSTRINVFYCVQQF